MKDRVPAEHGGAGVEVARAGLPSAFGWPDALDLLARAGAGSVFLYAGVVKAMDRQAMVLAVHGYRLAPKALEKPIATGLPWLEIALGAFLLLGLFTRFAGGGVALLSLVFVVAMAQAKARGLAIDCGCFGGNGTGTGVTWFDLIRDVPLLAAGAFLAWRVRGPFRLDRFLSEE
jgi:uncharacterized membrane protein YphA (DoxX/SURF4 family)